MIHRAHLAAVVLSCLACSCTSRHKPSSDTPNPVTDACAENHGGCDAHAVCTSTNGVASCACEPGYTGDGRACLLIDSCEGAPCLHGGSCANAETGYLCTCAAGYSGTNCEINIDDCEGNACQNGSSCEDGVNAYVCRCFSGDSGTYCESGPHCGDGEVDLGLGEQCDDGNAIPGDGCSGTCQVEPNWVCAQPGVACTWEPQCGNGLHEAGEECDNGDLGNGDGCSATCQIEPGYYCVPGTTPTLRQSCAKSEQCGDGEMQQGEACDTGAANGTGGCDERCQLVPGWRCVEPGVACWQLPVCGNGDVEAGEQCDDGVIPPVDGDGCSSNCRIESRHWNCPAEGGPCTSAIVCGNGAVEPGEQCDDGELPPQDGDGCSSACGLEAGWECPIAGTTCRPFCGDGDVTGAETCDLGTAQSPGCLHCRLQPGWKCTAATCTQSVCGNGTPEPGEDCDLGANNGVFYADGSGCTKYCTQAPSCFANYYTEAGCTSQCGDGIIAASEACDDGNPFNGDGCSSTCQLEAGFSCDVVESVDTEPCAADPLAQCLVLPITYRDFKQQRETAGHPDFFYQQDGTQNGIKVTCVPMGSPGPETAGLVKSLLNGSTGKPEYSGLQVSCQTGVYLISSSASFNQWFADTGGVNSTFQKFLELTPISGGYRFSSTSFFPIDESTFSLKTCDTTWPYWGSPQPLAGCPTGHVHQFGFTSELRYLFAYQGDGTESVSYTGDDDVWIFINGRLVIDVGGIHGPVSKSLTLTTSNQAAFRMTPGHIYEVALFHAERQPIASDFTLTLSGFSYRHSVCAPTCGDGVVTLGEECDQGDAIHTSCASSGTCNDDAAYGGCKTDCTFGPHCGDGIPQTSASDPVGPEECDDGENQAGYGEAGCAPGCKLPPSCGDHLLDQGEQCDASVDGYGGCSSTCTLNARCGDGTWDDPQTYAGSQEECDDGVNLTSYGFCGADCRQGTRCGDGLIQLTFGEQCDDGDDNGSEGHCPRSCGVPGRCGDHLVQSALGEACDDGVEANTGAYDACGSTCQPGPRCGDGVVQRDAGEECDSGAANKEMYGWCSTTCLLGAHCGDGVLQADEEQCDDGVDNCPTCACTRLCRRRAPQ